ncbi:hypothetical protein Cob_v006614 [Colletotrichum orbiculare MAFF 240422]|uniref:DUF7732 domain-containing protein n=2 Tax=Colletotrichum orbiculare species complex TaxID=2707354 RepID=N4V8H4_COLOR|nr:hypothetical protein Cob_v006614 [Colletotrichum orbiculare MAFF 240422]TDZ40255.1 hypothetical protein C8035_v003663 [Colletotrichum spinosum]
MRSELALVVLTMLCAPVCAAAVEPGLHASDAAILAPVEERGNIEFEQDEKLFKRKGGGGGGGGRGGGGSSSGGSRGGSSGGGRGATGTGGSARGGARDSSGGSTKTGSGPVPAYGGGRYYGGGGAVPYQAGQRRSGLGAPLLLGGAALAFWPGLWLASAYMYPYHHPYRFYNETARENQTKPIQCACVENQPCGCDENNSTEYMSSLIGNGSYDGLNKSVVNVADYEGNSTILINGTLPNGTTSAGGDDDVGTSNAVRVMAETLGFWPVAAVVLATVFTV